MTVKEAARIVAYGVSLLPHQFMLDTELRNNYHKAYKILYIKHRAKPMRWTKRKIKGITFQDQGHLEGQHLLEQLGLNK